MTRRGTDAAAEQRAAVVETHVSTLFFAGDRVYKRKKPVTYPFLDFSTLERREAACRREVELNRRLAPDVYLGISTVLGPDGTPCDYLVTMKRLPAERQLARLVTRRANAEPHIRRIARVLAAFHERAQTSDAIAGAGTREAVLQNWERNVEEMQRFVGRILPPVAFDQIARLARTYLAGRNDLFERRIAAGRVRDGHGDLQAADIFCLDDGPRILDCIEFDDRLRHADVAADVAYLAMDLERLGSPGLATTFVRWYREFSDDLFPSSLLDHYIAYRALVRCKVACLRFEQGDPDGIDEARALLEMARAHLVRARPVVVLVGGEPGTGKSTVSAGLAHERGWVVLRSDEIRKDLAGLAHERRAAEPYGAGLYSPVMTDATYRELLALARSAVAMGESVVLDASWSDAGTREAARTMAEEVHAELIQIRCVVPARIAARRLATRSRLDPSDATADVARRMRSGFDAWPDASQLDASRPKREVLRQALEILDATSRETSMAARRAG